MVVSKDGARSLVPAGVVELKHDPRTDGTVGTSKFDSVVSGCDFQRIISRGGPYFERLTDLDARSREHQPLCVRERESQDLGGGATGLQGDQSLPPVPSLRGELHRAHRHSQRPGCQLLARAGSTSRLLDVGLRSKRRGDVLLGPIRATRTRRLRGVGSDSCGREQGWFRQHCGGSRGTAYVPPANIVVRLRRLPVCLFRAAVFSDRE